MKNSLRLVSPLLLMLLLSVTAAWAQQRQLTSASQLKEQIQKMLAIESNSSTPAEIKEVNRVLLAGRRAQLRELLQQRLDALLKYRADLVDSMTPDLDAALRKEINGLIAELREVGSVPVERPTRRRATHAIFANEVSATAAEVPKSAGLTLEGVPPSDPVQAAVSDKVEISAANLVTSETPDASVRVTDPDVMTLRVTVTDDKGAKVFPKEGNYKEVKVEGRGSRTDQAIDIEVKEGKNTITVIGVRNDGQLLQAKPFEVTRKAAPTVAAKDGEKKTEATTTKIKINEPKKGEIYRNAERIPLRVTVDTSKEDKDKIETVQLVVSNKMKPVLQDSDTIKITYGEESNAKAKESVVNLRLLNGENDVTLFNYDADRNPKNATTMKITCSGDNCGTLPPVSTIPSNNMHMRAVVGLEQAGASSAESDNRPFLDLFFFGPLRYGNTCKGRSGNLTPGSDDCYPVWSTWGNVRFSSVPQQISAFGALASSFVSPLAEGRLTELVQGFNFMAGVDRYLFSTDKDFISPIPGVRFRSSVYLTAGFGAISPLTPQRSAQIFRIPAATNPQQVEFLRDFPEAARPGAEFIAFVAPERDRFLRQYYGGLRFKTHFIDKEGNVINRFPAILDATFGQSESVTGGRLRGPVFRLEAFYPFPIKEASFLYFYGSAFMKVGGKKSIKTPFILTAAESTVQLTQDNVVITTRQLDRDFFRIGIGVNLTDLFNRQRPPDAR